MSLQIDNVVVEVAGESLVGDVPQLDGAVLATGCDNVVVERVPLDVQHWTAVTADLFNVWKIGIVKGESFF